MKPRIKLEFGTRGAPDPFELREILAHVAEDFPDKLPDAPILVQTVALERTNRGKTTNIHALQRSGKLKPGSSRNFCDMFMLDAAGVTTRALAERDLLAQARETRA